MVFARLSLGKRFPLGIAIVFLVCCFQLLSTNVAVGQKLTIGSKAPALDIEHWVSDGDGEFSEVSEFESGKVYVVEFWATWCGPCIQAMPHLAEMQQQYADKGVQLISVSSEDLTTVENFLDRKIRGGSDDGPQTFGELTSTYCLTCDPDGSVRNDYMRASGQKGIPCAFLVGKSGLIEWIGHPLRLQKPLEKMVADQWDRDEYEAELAAEAKLKRQYEETMEEIEGLVNDDKAADAIAKLDAFVEEIPQDSRERTRLSIIRVSIAMHAGGDLAVDAINVLGESGQPVLINGMVRSIVFKLRKSEEFSDEILSAALEASRKSVAATRDSEDAKLAASSLNMHANMLFYVGQLDEAIKIQEQAVAINGSDRGKTFLDKLIKAKADAAEAE